MTVEVELGKGWQKRNRKNIDSSTFTIDPGEREFFIREGESASVWVSCNQNDDGGTISLENSTLFFKQSLARLHEWRIPTVDIDLKAGETFEMGFAGPRLSGEIVIARVKHLPSIRRSPCLRRR